VKITKTLTSVFTITLLLSLLIFTADQPSASACTIFLGRKIKFDMELSPKVPLFHPNKDGYFYPGSPKITKNLAVCNVGNIPFKTCRIYVTFYQDKQLAEGLQTEIYELAVLPKLMKPHLLYAGPLSNLSKGVDVDGKILALPRTSITLQISVWMPKTAGNKYQGLRMTADIAITVRLPPTCDRGHE